MARTKQSARKTKKINLKFDPQAATDRAPSNKLSKSNADKFLPSSLFIQLIQFTFQACEAIRPLLYSLYSEEHVSPRVLSQLVCYFLEFHLYRSGEHSFRDVISEYSSVFAQFTTAPYQIGDYSISERYQGMIDEVIASLKNIRFHYTYQFVTSILSPFSNMKESDREGDIVNGTISIGFKSGNKSRIVGGIIYRPLTNPPIAVMSCLYDKYFYSTISSSVGDSIPMEDNDDEESDKGEETQEQEENKADVVRETHVQGKKKGSRVNSATLPEDTENDSPLTVIVPADSTSFSSDSASATTLFIQNSGFQKKEVTGGIGNCILALFEGIGCIYIHERVDYKPEG
jgi:hypothetical protein